MVIGKTAESGAAEQGFDDETNMSTTCEIDGRRLLRNDNDASGNLLEYLKIGEYCADLVTMPDGRIWMSYDDEAMSRSGE
jgi:hypothetical protein